MGLGGLLFDEARAFYDKIEEEERYTGLSVDLESVPLRRSGKHLVDALGDVEEEYDDVDDNDEEDEDEDEDEEDDEDEYPEPLDLEDDFDDSFTSSRLAVGGMHDDGESSVLDCDSFEGSEEEEDYFSESEEWAESDTEEYDEDIGETDTFARSASDSPGSTTSTGGARRKDRSGSVDSASNSNTSASAFPSVTSKPRNKAAISAIRASLEDTSVLPHPQNWESMILVRRSPGMIKKADYASLSQAALLDKISPVKIHAGCAGVVGASNGGFTTLGASESPFTNQQPREVSSPAKTVLLQLP